MTRFLALLLLLPTISFSKPKVDGPRFKDTPTVLGPVAAGTVFDVDLRTTLSSQGVAPLTWSAVNLPKWLTLDSASNRLFGTPSEADSGTFSFRLSVLDVNEKGETNHATQITVLAPPKWKNSPLDLGIQNEGVAFTYALNSQVENPAGGNLTFSMTNAPAWMSLDGQGNISGTPKRKDVGTYTGIQITATGIGGSSTVSAYGKVLLTFHPPKWKATENVISDPKEDVSYSESVVSFVNNPEGAALTYKVVSQTPPPWMQVGETNGTLIGTPNVAHLGPGSIVLSISTTYEGVEYVDAATFKYTVQHTNHAPLWSANPITLPAAWTGAGYQQTLASSFKDKDKGDTFKIAFAPGTQATWLRLDSDGNLSGTPSKTDLGVKNWQVVVTDQDGASDTTTLTIEVLKSNEAPYWVSKPTTLGDAAEDKPFELDLNAPKYAVDPDSDPMTFSKLSGPTWLNLSPQGKLSGTPGKTDVGTQKFSFKVTDGTTGSDVTDFLILVVHTNHSPTWTLSPIHLSVKEDAAMNIALSQYANDPDGDTPLTYGIVSGLPWVTLSSDGHLTGTPGASEVGPNHLRVKIADPTGASAEADVVITVIHVNHAPYWTQNPVILPAVDEDTPVSEALSAFAADKDKNDILSFSLLSGPAWAKVSASGILTGIPSRPDVGLNSIRVRVTDPHQENAEVVVQIQVKQVNKAPRWRQNPILLADSFVNENYQFSLASYATDDDGDPLTFALVSGPKWMAVSANGVISGIPAKDDKGPFSASFTATDSKAAPVPGSGNGTVIEKNVAPVIGQIPIFVAKERATMTDSLQKYVTDANGDKLNFVLADTASWISLSKEGEVKASPEFKQIGLHTFRFNVDDGQIPAHGTFQIRVERDPRPPKWTTDPVKLVGKTNQTMTGSIASYAKDEDGLPLTFQLKSGKPWLSADSNGSLGGAPKEADFGLNSFVVSACNDMLCAEAGLLIDVQWGTKEDSYATDDWIPGSRADNLWVVDNSQQCDKLIRELKGQIGTYFGALAQKEVHHSGVYLSSDAHKFDGMPIRDQNQSRVFKWSDTNLAKDFGARVNAGYSPGNCGNCYNSPIWTIFRFEERVHDLTDVYHNDFLTPAVPMDALILTQQLDHYKWYTKQDPEHQNMTPAAYAKAFSDFHRLEGQNLRISAVAPKCPSLSSGEPSFAASENAYQTLVKNTGGTYYTVSCDFDMGRFLKDYADKVAKRASLFAHHRFGLTQTPVETQTMKVWLGDRELTTEQWHYDAKNNEVEVFWHLIDNPKVGDKIRVLYRMS